MPQRGTPSRSASAYSAPLTNRNYSCHQVLTGQIAIAGTGGNFSSEGDSGSLVCTPDLHPIGLIVGGSQVTAQSLIAHSFISPHPGDPQLLSSRDNTLIRHRHVPFPRQNGVEGPPQQSYRSATRIGASTL